MHLEKQLTLIVLVGKKEVTTIEAACYELNCVPEKDMLKSSPRHLIYKTGSLQS